VLIRFPAERKDGSFRVKARKPALVHWPLCARECARTCVRVSDGALRGGGGQNSTFKNKRGDSNSMLTVQARAPERLRVLTRLSNGGHSRMKSRDVIESTPREADPQPRNRRAHRRPQTRYAATRLQARHTAPHATRHTAHARANSGRNTSPSSTYRRDQAMSDSAAVRAPAPLRLHLRFRSLQAASTTPSDTHSPHHTCALARSEPIRRHPLASSAHRTTRDPQRSPC
jgi:hypothetical protein